MFLLACLVGLLLALIPHTVQAQATADVLGTVTDSTGAVVANAKVTATDIATGIRNTVQTSNTGEYLLSHLQVGTYKLTVEAKGFKTFVQTGLVLNANDRARANAQLSVGSQVETVQIEASEAPALKTDSSTIDTTITTTSVADMPLDGRNIQNLVQLSAGVTEGAYNAPAGAQGFNGHADDLRPTSVFSANGMSDMYNNQMIDGMDNNERSIGTQVIKPSLDAIDQVIVMTDLYPAEYGRSAGGIMNVITKSGGNQFHGGVYEYDRNDAFDAYTYNFPLALGGAASPVKGELRQNQFGGSIGGPVLKNKIFFFGDYEGFRLIDAVGSTTGTVPDAQERAAVAGATAGTPLTFTDDYIHKSITTTPSALGLNLFKLFPAPTSTAVANNYTGHNRTTQNWNTYDARVDAHFSDKNLIFGRFSHNVTDTGVGYPFPSIKIGSVTYDNTLPTTTISNGVGLDWTHTISPSMLFEAKAGYNRYANASGTTSGLNAATNLGFAACTGVSSATNPVYCINSPYGGASQGLPSIGLTNYGLQAGPSNGIGDGMFAPLNNVSQAYQYMASLLVNRGPHSMKFGAGVVRRQLSRLQSPSGRGSYGNSGIVSGSDLGDMLAGFASNVQQQTTLNFPQYRSWEPSVYAQDDWRYKPWLTLNLGIRYDIETAFTDKHGQMSNFNSTLGILQSPSLVGIYQSGSTADVATGYADISPRLGFSASLRHQMVVRGGIGFSYFSNEEGGGTDVSLANFPYSWSVDYGYQYNSDVPAAMAVPGATITNGYTTCSGTSIGCAINMAAGITEPYLSASTVTALPTGTEIDGIENNLKPGRVVQYSLELQKEFGPNVVSLGYIGNLARHLPYAPDINQAAYATAAGQGPQPYTSSTTLDHQDLTSDSIYMTSSDADGAYNAMQATYIRRLASGLMVTANYTFAKGMNNGSQQGEGGTRPVECVRAGCLMDNGHGGTTVLSGFKQYDWGLSDISVHHRVAAQVAYAIPAGNLTGPLAYAAKNWNVSGIWLFSTGMPESLTNCNGPPPCGNTSGINGWRGADAPDQLGNPNGGPHQLSEWFNTSMFALQTPFTLGNAKRNSIIGPNTKRLDLSLAKDFPLYESVKFQFRADAFNATNSPSFGEPADQLNGPNWGAVTSMSNNYKPREFQFSGRISF